MVRRLRRRRAAGEPRAAANATNQPTYGRQGRRTVAHLSRGKRRDLPGGEPVDLLERQTPPTQHVDRLVAIRRRDDVDLDLVTPELGVQDLAVGDDRAGLRSQLPRPLFLRERSGQRRNLGRSAELLKGRDLADVRVRTEKSKRVDLRLVLHVRPPTARILRDVVELVQLISSFLSHARPQAATSAAPPGAASSTPAAPS
jgi:hypothetical protein